VTSPDSQIWEDNKENSARDLRNNRGVTHIAGNQKQFLSCTLELD
jgi:hypothetical protein